VKRGAAAVLAATLLAGAGCSGSDGSTSIRLVVPDKNIRAEDWEVERIPTFCVLELEVDLPARPGYRLLLGRGRPIEFAAAEEPVELVVS
jgi:hypothetical protein